MSTIRENPGSSSDIGLCRGNVVNSHALFLEAIICCSPGVATILLSSGPYGGKLSSRSCSDCDEWTRQYEQRLKQLDMQSCQGDVLQGKQEGMDFAGSAPVESRDSPSTNYVTGSGKFAFTWTESGELIPDATCRRLASFVSRSPGLKHEDMESVYSDAADTFASWSGHFELDGLASLDLPVQCTDVKSRDFIMKRFLTAAQAMATEDETDSTSTSSLPSDERPARNSEAILPTGRQIPSKSRFAREAQQDMQEGGYETRAGGFALKIGRMTLKHFKHGFRTARSSKKSCKSPQMINTTITQKKVQDEGIESSDDLFWCVEDSFKNTVPSNLQAEEEWANSSELKVGQQEGETDKGTTTKGAHLLETGVHPLDHQGFLGLPKMATGLRTGGETEQPRQVDRLGARLTHMISKANYVESPRATVRINEHDEIDTSSHGPSSVSSSSTDSPTKPTKFVGKVGVGKGAPVMPLPSLSAPSQSWLCTTLPPSRFAGVQKPLSRKPSIGRRNIYTRPPVAPSKQQTQEETAPRMRQSCSYAKGHLHGRQVFSSTAQAV